MFRNVLNFIHPGRAGGLTWAGYLLSALGLVGGVVVGPHSTTTTIVRPTAPLTTQYVPPQRATFPPPYDPGPPKLGGAGVLQVHNVFTCDTHLNISAAINASAKAYGLNPVGYVALMGTESNVCQYAPHYQMAGAGYCDDSAGLVQITVCTAAGYPLYIGDGTLSGANINYVFNYEQGDPTRESWLGAKLLAYFKSSVCWDFTPLYSAWNQGPGYGCFNSIYQYPQGWIAQQAYHNYLGWWDYAWANYATYAAPPKPYKFVFPWKSWCAYAWPRHLTCASPFANRHGRLTWPASIFYRTRQNRHVGGFRSQVFYQRTPMRRHAFMKYVYQDAVAYAWFDFHDYRITVRGGKQ